jgi:hypothetical protein
MHIQTMQEAGQSVREIAQVEQAKDRQVAQANISVSGGCAGEAKGNFRTDQAQPKEKAANAEEAKKADAKKTDPKKAKKEKGPRSEWMRCVHCPLCNKDGVDARIDYFPERNKKRITCSTCHGHKDYEHKF